MMTRAKNGIVKQKTYEDFYCFSAVAQQKLYDEHPSLVDLLLSRTLVMLLNPSLLGLPLVSQNGIKQC
jgi:hypothetical protein